MSGSVFNPLLLLKSPLGDDTLPMQTGTLHAIGWTAREQVSRPFEGWITVVSTHRAIAPDDLLFQPVSLTVRKDKGEDRLFNGLVRRMEAAGLARRDRWQYRLQVVPKLRFLDQTGDCRIFQQKTAVQILQEIFIEHRIDPVEFKIFGDRPLREYTTQFNESDLVFVHRLMQESGYFYYFEHTADAHRLIVTDRNQSFKPLRNPVHWVIHEGSNIDIFDRWTETMRTSQGSVRLQDYDPAHPSEPVQGQQTTTLPTPGAAQRDLFVWPANTIDNQVAAERARYRIEADEAEAGLRGGRGYDPQLLPGARFTLGRDPFSGQEDIDHAIHSVEHTATDETWIAGAAPSHYENSFTCFLQTTSWREPLNVPRPAMSGLFSAIVLGEAGEEIHADPLARIKIRLLFDRRRDTVASMATWVRVVHPWAGNTWGWQHLPRVGTEVAVCFMNGDPDTPAVLGGFYNEQMRPVFPVPDQQTRQGFRSRSTPHGSTQDYSELSFDDKKDAERILLHAQKDFRTETERDSTIEIGRDQTVTVEHNHSLTTTTGDISVTAEAGMVTISATTVIKLNVGATVITITPEGVTVAALVNINLTAPTITTEGAEMNVTSAAVTFEGATVNMILAGGFQVEAPEVTLATAEFLAPLQGT